jgi:hypothetical protein
MKTLRIIFVGLALMLAITGNAIAQGGGTRGSGDFIDFDIINNVVEDGTDSNGEVQPHEWPWQVGLHNTAVDESTPSNMTDEEADSGQSENAIKSGDRFFFTHTGSQ